MGGIVPFFDSVALREAVRVLVQTSVDRLQELFDPASRNNIYNPLQGDAAFNTYYLAGVPSALARYGTSGLIPVVAGQTYWIDVRRAALDWNLFDPSPATTSGGIFFFTGSPASALTYHSRSNHNGANNTVFYGDLNNFRYAKFTAPVGATHAAVIFRDVSGAAPTLAEFDAMRVATMVTHGAAPLPYEPYVIAGSLEPGAEFDPDPDLTRPTQVVKDGVYLYVRNSFNATYDLVQKIDVGSAASYTSNGTIDYVGARLIPIDSPYTPDAFAIAGTLGHILTNQGDESPPVYHNSMFLGGGHGILGVEVTHNAHTKTNVDVGSRWTDGAAKVWVLARVVDANKLLLIPNNTGTATAWVISGTITGNLTHTAGATHVNQITPTASAGAQLYTILKSLVKVVELDGIEITADGTYYGDDLRLHESYEIANAASVLTRLIALVGNAAAPVYNEAAIASQIKLSHTYIVNYAGAIAGHHAIEFLQASSIGYFGGVQAQAIAMQSPHTQHQYVRGAAAFSGYDLQATADITALAAELRVTDARMVDANNPPDVMATIAKLAGVPKYGIMIGLGLRSGAGVPATRAANTNEGCYISALKKQYLEVVSGTAAAVAAGTFYEWTTHRAVYSAEDTRWTVKALISEADKHLLTFDTHQTLSNEWIPVDARHIGKPVTVVQKHANVTVHSAVVTDRGIRVSVAAGYGHLRLAIDK